MLVISINNFFFFYQSKSIEKKIKEYKNEDDLSNILNIQPSQTLRLDDKLIGDRATINKTNILK